MSEQTMPDVYEWPDIYEWIEAMRNRKDVAVGMEIDLTASPDMEEGEDD